MFTGLKLKVLVLEFVEKVYKTQIFSGGYKGYGLGMMVEILCATMSGSEFGPNVRIWKTRDKIANYVRTLLSLKQKHDILISEHLQ